MHLHLVCIHLNRVKRRLIFDQQPKTHPCHRGKIWEYAGYFVYITNSNCTLFDRMIRGTLNNQVWKQNESLSAETDVFGSFTTDSIDWNSLWPCFSSSKGSLAATQVCRRHWLVVFRPPTGNVPSALLLTMWRCLRIYNLAWDSMDQQGDNVVT